MADREYGFKTRAIHAGNIPDQVTGARALPIYQTSAFVFDDTADAAARFALQKYGNIYSRLANPTVASFEERVASLEGGLGAVATASGLSAQYITFASLAGTGDHIVASANLYGGSITQLDVTLRRFGVETTFVRSSDPADYAAAITDKTKALFVETIANPSGEIADLEGLADVAHAHGIPFIVDSTIADALPEPPDRVGRRHRHALRHEVPRRARHDPRRRRRRVGPLPLAQREVPALRRARAELRRAPVVGQLRRVRVPHPAARRAAARHRPARSRRTRRSCSRRASRRCRTASRRTSTTRARSPSGSTPTRASSACSGRGSPSHPHHERAQKYLPKGPGSVFSFEVKGGRAVGQKLIESVNLASHLANIGDAKTLIIHPASTTHAQLTEQQLVDAGVLPGVVRLSRRHRGC